MHCAVEGGEAIGGEALKICCGSGLRGDEARAGERCEEDVAHGGDGGLACGKE